ncbi:class I SAM-dependent methyltransferase [bacterium]|nr:class I SAM-dependent methyltransferase [bacterium]
MTEFKDHFSDQSRLYAKYRPDYPPDLFAWLAKIAPGRGLAWDASSGNGQAAVALAEHFERVIANDASAAQIAHARPHERVEYVVRRSEDVELPEGSVDLVTCAQALHWLDLDAFYKGVTRALARGGVLAVWSYGTFETRDEATERVRRFYDETVGSYWPPERAMVEARYRTIPFPFEEIDVPAFEIRRRWTLDDMAGYLRSWSATQNFIRERGFDPVDDLVRELEPLWGGAGASREMVWPLAVRAGRRTAVDAPTR